VKSFAVAAPFSPAGDQAQAIDRLSRGVEAGLKYQTLKGVTGSGKTYSMAKIIEQVQLPTLVLSHNKTLAAQLYREFKDFFPENAVEYFVSYYDYYQPEAYVPGKTRKRCAGAWSGCSTSATTRCSNGAIFGCAAT